MLCERCKKNEAKVHIIKIINGEKSETLLCEKCAKELTEIPFDNKFIPDNKMTFQNILSGFFETLDKGNKNQKIEVVCKSCGLTYSEFKKNGKLGCSNCYKSFQDLLKSRIKRIQGDTEHIGKIPKRESNEVIQRKRINKLKEELQQAIINEEYEEAAVIRDKIKLLESARGGKTTNE